ncbi:MAG: ribbon-helix-helix protein, CopG family [Betaproteobacteria bacterium]|nr:MAG: ribbon-helix-helix protein, CopG family [Betaproteobacteria bacterium]
MGNMVLTPVYLEPEQKKALAKKAKASGKSVSELLREAVDAKISGAKPHEVEQLDAASKRAMTEIDAMIDALKTNSSEHRKFLRALEAARTQHA